MTICVLALVVLAPATTAVAQNQSPDAATPIGRDGTTVGTPLPADSMPDSMPDSTSAPATASTDEPAGGPGSPRAGDPPAGEPRAPAGSPEAGPAAGPWTPGIDISNYQHPNGAAINWNAVAASGKRYAFVKATEGPVGCTGGHYTNPYFSSDYNAAGSVGMWRGAYHFARPRLPLSTAADDARRFVAVAGVPSGSRDLPPVLDMEQSCGLSDANVVAWARTWLEQVRVLTGSRGIVYTGYYFWNDFAGNDHSIANAGYPLWMARYASQAEPLMGGWTSWAFWQWTSSGSVPGIVGNVDLDHFNGDEVSLGHLVSASRGVSPSLDVTHNLDGRAELVYVDGAGTLFQRWESGGWSGGWVRQTGVRRAAIDRNADGRLEVFAVRTDGHLIHSWQTCPGCGWSGWYSMGNGFAGSALDTGHNQDGRLELVARNGYGVIVHAWQSCAICGWTDWFSMGIAGGGAVTIGHNADGRMEMFAVNPKVIHAWQNQPNGGWSWWYDLGNTAEKDSAISSARSSDGRVIVTWRSAGSGAGAGKGYAIRQAAPSGLGGWGPVSTLPWSDVSTGPALSGQGGGTWAAACTTQNTVVTASINATTGNWQAGGSSPSAACRATAVLTDRPGPLVLVLGEGVQGAIPGQAAGPL